MSNSPNPPNPSLPHEIINETLQKLITPIKAIKGDKHTAVLIDLISITQNTMQLSQLACYLSLRQTNPDSSKFLHTYGHSLEEHIILGYESLLENLESRYPGIGQDFLVISKKIKEIIEMN